MTTWRLAHGLTIDCSRPVLVGIINVTPDSFADGGRHLDPIAARDAAELMAAHGADMIDLGGESTRPGSARVAADEQLRRVLPVLQAVRRGGGSLARIPISIDTTLGAVGLAVLDAGANAVNDVSGGEEDASLLHAAASRGAGYVLMHRLRTPEADSYSDRYERPPAYDDVVDDVGEWLNRCAMPRAFAAGLSPDQLVVDPGLGFGKSVEDNLALIRGTGRLVSQTGRPVMSALSRKSFVGRISLNRDSTPEERLEGTLALSVLHLGAGARVFRVHDVAPHAAALRAAWMTMEPRGT
jgi:dihydropteroate synthase